MPTRTDTTTLALSKLVEYLQQQNPSPELDDIQILLDGPTDVIGNPTAAMDRRAKRDMRRGILATDSKAAVARSEMFPHAARLGR